MTKFFHSELMDDSYVIDDAGNYIGPAHIARILKTPPTEAHIRKILCSDLPPALIVNRFYNEENVWWEYKNRVFSLYRDDMLIRRFYPSSGRLLCFFEERELVSLCEPEQMVLDDYIFDEEYRRPR